MSANTKKLMPLSLNTKGFTLVELNISMGVLAILGASFITIFTTFVAATTRSNYSIEMTTNSQNLLRTIVEEIRYGAGVRQTNSITDPNPDAPAGGWNTSNTNFVIITAVPALNSTGDYIIDPITGSPYMNELVYYKSGKTLYKRILAHPSATGNRTATSCSPSSVSPGCVADRRLAENLETIEFTLYNQDNVEITNSILARSVKIDLTLQRDTFGPPITYSNSIRVTLRNQF